MTGEQGVARQQGEGEEFSAGYVMGGPDTMTVGLKWGTRMEGNQELSARIELYQQSGDTQAADLDALITQIGYTFYF